MNTLRDDIQQYKPAIALNRIASRKTLKRARLFLFIVFSLTGTSYVISEYAFSGQYAQHLLGTSLVSLAPWLEQLLIYLWQ